PLPQRPLCEDGDQRDPAGGDGLHERQRRQVHRDDVETPPRHADDEREQPAAMAEEQPERLPRPADRERRQLRGDRVLRDPRPVERRRGRKSEQEPDDEGEMSAEAHVTTSLCAWTSSLQTNSASSRKPFGPSSTTASSRSLSRTTSTTSSTSS